MTGRVGAFYQDYPTQEVDNHMVVSTVSMARIEIILNVVVGLGRGIHFAPPTPGSHPTESNIPVHTLPSAAASDRF